MSLIPSEPLCSLRAQADHVRLLPGAEKYHIEFEEKRPTDAMHSQVRGGVTIPDWVTTWGVWRSLLMQYNLVNDIELKWSTPLGAAGSTTGSL